MSNHVSGDAQFTEKTIAGIEKRHGKPVEQLFAEREKRVTDAINLREPDRVPVNLAIGEFVSRYTGMSPAAAFYEPDVFKEAFIRTAVDFEPDMCGSPSGALMSGLGLETIDVRQMRWPGGNLPPDSSLQFLDAENMKAAEYDIFLTDPTDFMLRYYLPRTLGALSPLSGVLPPLGQSLAGNVPGLFSMTPILAGSAFREMAGKVARTGAAQERFLSSSAEDMTLFGFPPVSYSGGVCGGFASGTAQPFDWIADQLRGMKGIVDDMFKRPEKLLLACERVLEWRLARAEPADPAAKGYPRRVAGGITHWSSDGFLSKKQFETFCWPTWKKALQATIDLGFIPSVYLEGPCDKRIEYFLELPRGKVMLRFEQSDIFRAKEIVGGHCCISGNVPSSMMQVGSPQDVDEYCRKLIRVCGKGGGFILSPGAALTRHTRTENVRALRDSVEKYGRY
jgi:hypothetical protein